MRSLTTTTAILCILAAGSAFAQTNMPTSAQPTSVAPVRTAPAGNLNNGYGAPAYSTGSAIDSQGSGAISAMPLEVQTAGNISFINGGISDEEVAQLKAQEHNYNVHLLINTNSGEFTSDVKLVVADSAGTALLTISDAGPYVYLQMPKGKYVATATDPQGQSKKINLNVNGKTIRQQLVFKESGEAAKPHAPTATID